MSSMNDIINEMLSNGIRDGVFPCFAAAVGKDDEIIFKSFGGDRCIFPAREALTENTLFDMASLSKLIGTTMAALKMVVEGKISFESKLEDYFDCCHGKEKITVFQLLTHTSGIKAHFPLYLRGISPDDAVTEILKEELGYSTGSNAVYSCMGFILLGKILERIENEPLDRIVQRYVFDPLEMKNSTYRPKGRDCAATEKDIFSKEIISGVVHDENARFLGGISGNAGIFCDLGDCIKFAQMLSRKGRGYLPEELFKYAISNLTPNFSEGRGLGFQRIGKLYGHTGFTGTSIYVDSESGRYAILLTNRVHPTRENTKLIPFRREFHKTVFGE